MKQSKFLKALTTLKPTTVGEVKLALAHRSPVTPGAVAYEGDVVLPEKSMDLAVKPARKAGIR